jgi:hypothetical protein
MLSMGMLSSPRRCRKWRRICLVSPSHRLPAADVYIVFFFIVDGSDGRKRWRTCMLGRRRRAGAERWSTVTTI